jgi:para-nitrobenzyl esterase
MMQRQPHLRTCNEAEMRADLFPRVSDKTGSLFVPEERIDSLIAAYKRTRPAATPYDLLVAISSDRMRVGAIRAAERKAAVNRAPVYMYLFTWESPFDGGFLRCCHTLEMPFVFNNVEPPCGMIGTGPERKILAKNISSAWVAFARSGNPGHAGLPSWPTYTPEKRATMVLNVESRVEEDPFSEERKAWDGIS